MIASSVQKVAEIYLNTEAWRKEGNVLKMRNVISENKNGIRGVDVAADATIVAIAAIAAIFALQVMFQIVGAVHYDVFPDWLWGICDALILVTPFILGLIPGVICCMPNFIAEIIWLIVKGYLGAFLHGAAFMTTVVLAGVTETFFRKVGFKISVPLYVLAFEASLIFENFLYRLLRTLFLTSKTSQFTFGNIFRTTFSIGNLVCLLLLLAVLIYRYMSVTDKDEKSGK